ncbi:MAG: tRNA dihydrouridine(20/20a) synthase DusA [Alphaproteobacteria bacterium]|nr:tRNA dihydrouridine(20/20a) synthase DusA [Alphaproteobacteria bacterium]
MMDRTDRHGRFFLRLLTRHTLLYTEMTTTGAILRGSRDRHLGFDPRERPLALQLGGSDPVAMAECAALADSYGYDEININAGCPSDRVRDGRFGACLMAEPETVAACIRAMATATRLPITVKHRIGIDKRDDYGGLVRFVRTITDAGCRSVIVHARIAVLGGLSPKANRTIPPLQYPTVWRLKQDFPEIHVVINGGIRCLSEARDHLARVDGVMIGREAYTNPYLLATADREIFGDAAPASSRSAVAEALANYMAAQAAGGVPAHRITRHVHGLLHGIVGARGWRRVLSGASATPDPGWRDTLLAAAAAA